MKNKDFDCVNMKNLIQETIHEEIKDLHGRELLDYLKHKVDVSSFADWWKSGINSKKKSDTKVA